MAARDHEQNKNLATTKPLQGLHKGIGTLKPRLSGINVASMKGTQLAKPRRFAAAYKQFLNRSNDSCYYGEFHSSAQTGIQFSDPALLGGYGIFGFLRTIDGKPTFPADHLHRFETGAALMRLVMPESRFGTNRNHIRIKQVIPS